MPANPRNQVPLVRRSGFAPLDAEVEMPGGRKAPEVFERRFPNIVMRVVPVVFKGRPERHGAPPQSSYQSDTGLEVPIRGTDQHLPRERRRGHLKISEDFRATVTLPHQPHAELALEIAKTGFSDLRRASGCVARRSFERGPDERRLELDREPIGQSIANEEQTLGAPEPAEEVLVGSEAKLGGLVLPIVVQRIGVGRVEEQLATGYVGTEQGGGDPWAPVPRTPLIGIVLRFRHYG